MTKAEILKASAGIVSALIKSKTPELTELEKAHKDLGSILKTLSPGDAVTTDVATDINSVMERMESFRSGYCSNDPSQTKTNKSFSLPDFTVYLKTEVDAALAEKSTAKTLKRLHTLANQIEEAGKVTSGLPGLNKAESIEDTTTVSFTVFTDPAQIVTTDSTSSAALAQSGAPAGDSAQFSNQGGSAPAAGNATTGNIATQGTGNPADGGNYQAAKAATPPAVAAPVEIVPAAVLGSVAATVEKSGASTFDGWPMDLNAPARKSDVHFGKDPLRHRG